MTVTGTLTAQAIDLADYNKTLAEIQALATAFNIVENQGQLKIQFDVTITT